MSLKRSLVAALTPIFALSITVGAVAQEKSQATEATQAAAAAPQLTLVEPIRDFGIVPKGQKLDWAFQVKNTGNADLVITSANPSCGCTVADFDKVIKPGSVGKVVAHVDTVSFNGPISKHVTIQSNDPQTPSAQVTINATVKPYVEAHPGPFVRYSMLQGEKPTPQTITLYSEDEGEFQIVGVEAPKFVNVSYRKAEEAERVKAGKAGQAQYKFDVTLNGASAPIGPLNEKVVIKTNSKFQPEYTLTVNGVVRPNYMVSPMSLNFGEVMLEDENSSTRRVSVTSNSKVNPEAFTISKVESTAKGVSATLAPSETPGTYEVVVQVDKKAKAGEFRGDVKIYTSDKLNPTYTLPVSGLVRK